MYLDTFLGSIGVEESVIKKIRSSLDGFADDISGMRVEGEIGFGGSPPGSRMKTHTTQTAQHITAAMQELADVLREFGINLELWQNDMSYTDDDAAVQMQAIQKVQERVERTHLRGAGRAPSPAPATTGGA